MLDVGCGSGILSIAAAKLGFQSVRGSDYDEDTVRIFYGASDEVICSAEFSIKEILDSLFK